MRPFTILFHGTGEHQEKGLENKEVLHEITKMLAGEPYTDYLVCDGVGSVGTDLNPTPGQFDFSTRNKLPKDPAAYSYTDGRILDHLEDPRPLSRPSPPPPARPPSSGWAAWLDGWYNSLASLGSQATRWATNKKIYLEGIFKGVGMDDNIRHAVAVVVTKYSHELDLSNSPPPKITLNLLGWSRGAVTAIRAANYFSRLLEQSVDINIFAFDPVPGGRLNLDDERTLGKSVKSYVSVLCLHERRDSFLPIDMTGTPRCRLDLRELPAPIELAMLPLPGVHSTPLYFNDNRQRLHESAEVGRYLAWKFLKLKGTTFTENSDSENPPAKFTPIQLCEKYAKMMLELDDYAKLDPKVITALESMPWGHTSIKRPVLTDRQSYLHRQGNCEFFLNEHHWQAFSKAYPAALSLRGRSAISLTTQYAAELAARSGQYTIGGTWRARTEQHWAASLRLGEELLNRLMER